MNVAVMLAYNQRNAGMYSVDLAAQKFFRESGHKFNLYRALHGRYFPFLMNGSLLRCLQDREALKRADAIVYWGDFAQNPLYGTIDFHMRETRAGKRDQPLSDSVEKWKQFFLLKDFAREHRKVFSVSTNFQSANRILDSLEPESAAEIKQLLGQFDGIYPRDRESTREVREMVSSDWRADVRYGVDAAFLNREDGVQRQPVKPTTFTYMFHRSKITEAEENALVSAVAQATGLKPVHLADWVKLKFRKWDRQFASMTRELQNAAFNLSDTYHCLINAMINNTPTIGIGRAEAIQTSSVSEFKKRELFAMFDLSEYYFEFGSADLGPEVIEKVAALGKRIAKGEVDPDMYASVDQQTSQYREHLRSVQA